MAQTDVPLAPTKVQPVLVLAWGNISRGDDALGPLLLKALQAELPEGWRTQIAFLEDYQLQIEHALDLVGRRQVLLVDASLSCPAPFEVTALQPQADASFTTHALSPATLLQVYQNLQGCAPPPCTLLAIRGEAFELGQPLSPTAQTHLQAALLWATEWVGRCGVSFKVA